MLNFRKVGLLTLISFVGLVLNTLYYILQIHYFGIGREIENYFVAISLCGFALSFTIVGHIGQMVLPIYLEQKEKYNSAVADEIYSVVFNWMMTFSIVITVFLFFSSSFFIQLLTPGFATSDHLTINTLFDILILTIPLQVANILIGSLLNANKIYGRLETLNVFRILCSILILVFFFEKLGLYALVIGYQLESILYFFLNIFLVVQEKFSYHLRFTSETFQPISFFKNSSVAYLRNGSRELFQFTLTASVSFLPEGILAIYKYTESILMKVAALVLNPIQTIFFTSVANEYAINSSRDFSMVSKALNFCFLYIILVVSFCASFGNDILSILWSNHFESTNQNVAYLFLLFQMITLFPLAIKGLFFKTALIYKEAKAIYTALAVSWIIATAFCYLTVRYFEIGGLAAVILFTPFISAIFAFGVIYKKDRQIRQVFKLDYALKLLCILCISIISGYFINEVIGIISIVDSKQINLLLSFGIKSILFGLICLAQLKQFRFLNFETPLN
jgi:peptidoglycan biosynthesis protein MviN/MurJ (putative lipid II flippase)